VEWTPEKVARFWDFYGTHRQGDFFSEKHSWALVDAALRICRPRRLVDIGCGTGAFVRELARRGISTIGVDSSPAVLDEASARPSAGNPAPEFRLGSVSSLPVDDGEADFVTLIEAVEHFDDRTLAGALTEARRILNETGVLMITTPNAEDLVASTVQCPDCGAEFHVMQHVRRWTPHGLEDLLLTSGFGNVRVRPVRFVENGPLLERLVRSAVYRVRPHRPRLVATATRV
jgi:ubiquinone/menaquinone biosynthesis C-methylase UbiE